MHLDSTFCIDLMRERSRGDEAPALPIGRRRALGRPHTRIG